MAIVSDYRRASDGNIYRLDIIDNGDGTYSSVETRIDPASITIQEPPSTTDTLTREQFAVKVLMKLTVYDAGSQLEPADLRNVKDAYDAIYQTLLDEGLVTWKATDNIPIRFSLPLIDLVASQIKLYYGIPQTPFDTMPILDQPPVKTIRRQLASPYVPDVTATEYF